MAFALEDDEKVFEATMSFVDEFPFDEAVNGGASTAQGLTNGLMVQTQAHNEVALMPHGSRVDSSPANAVMEVTSNGIQASGALIKASPFKRQGALLTNEDKRKHRAEVNARKKMLRKAGVYGNSNRVRNERRLEIAYLRERIEKLQLDLKTLQTQKNSQGDSSPEKKVKQPSSLVVVHTASQISGVWHEIADRQQRRRKEAERESIRLKLIVERQRKVAHTLSSLLQKRASQLTNDCSCFTSIACKKHQVVHVLDYRGDVSAFQGLFRHLDAAYRDIDAVFSANGLSSMVITPSDVHIRENNGGKNLEFFSNKVLPYPLRTTAEAAWNHFKGTDKHMGNGNLYAKTAKPLDEPYTIIEDFTKEVFSNSARADVKMKQVVRRYVEGDRDIVIWVASVAPAEVKHKMLRGLTYHLRGHALTKRSAASTPEQEISQLQFCTLITFDQEAEKRYGPDNLRALTNFLIVNTAQNMRVHQNGIENALIDQALGQKLS